MSVKTHFPLFPGPAWMTLTALALIALLTTLFYRTLNPEWVKLREAHTAYQRGDHASATLSLTGVRELGKGDPDLENRIAELSMSLDQWEQARTALQNVLADKPADASAASSLAGVLQHLQEPEEALHVLLAAQEAGARFDSQTQLQLAGLYRQLKLYPEAEAIYRSILQISALKDSAALPLAEMLAWQQQYDESQALLRDILATNPDNKSARMALARVLGWSGQSQESVREYQILLQQ